MRSLNINKTDRKGRKRGIWETYWYNGNIEMRGPYKNDLAEGEWEFYYMDGKLHSKGSYVNDEKEGIWEYYNTDGSLDCKRLFDNGYNIEFVK
jgi:antitoxin component YwqK of YwqJK toxin-antitoxin module